MANVRTAVKTRRIAPGVYGTLDGSYRTQRNDKGRWVLHSSDGSQVGEQDGYRTSDEALTALVDVPGGRPDHPEHRAREAGPERREGRRRGPQRADRAAEAAPAEGRGDRLTRTM